MSYCFLIAVRSRWLFVAVAVAIVAVTAIVRRLLSAVLLTIVCFSS